MRREHAPGDPETRAGDARLRPGPEGRLEAGGAARAAEPGAGQSGTACGGGGCSDGDQNQERPQLCVSLIFWILVLFSVSLCFIGHLPFPFFCSLWCDFAFLFLVSQAGLTGGGTSLFGGRVWSATTFPLSLALVVARKCFVFIQFRIISPLTSYLVHELFRSVLLIFQAFGDFPETSILLNSMDREQTL